jgi:hypothetical protein
VHVFAAQPQGLSDTDSGFREGHHQKTVAQAGHGTHHRGDPFFRQTLWGNLILGQLDGTGVHDAELLTLTKVITRRDEAKKSRATQLPAQRRTSNSHPQRNPTYQ